MRPSRGGFGGRGGCRVGCGARRWGLGWCRRPARSRSRLVGTRCSPPGRCGARHSRRWEGVAWCGGGCIQGLRAASVGSGNLSRTAFHQLLADAPLSDAFPNSGRPLPSFSLAPLDGIFIWRAWGDRLCENLFLWGGRLAFRLLFLGVLSRGSGFVFRNHLSGHLLDLQNLPCVLFPMIARPLFSGTPNHYAKHNENDNERAKQRAQPEDDRTERVRAQRCSRVVHRWERPRRSARRPTGETKRGHLTWNG